MLLLAVDTSGKQGSISLARCSPDEGCEVLGVAPLEGGTFSAQLIPQIAELLRQHGFSKQDIGAFVVVAGPGSFTGLRVGLSGIKGLAEVLQKPIVTVSLLEAVAVASGADGNLVAALDAGRGDVYAGEYELSGAVKMQSERLLSFAELISAAAGKKLVTPDQIVADKASVARIETIRIDRPGSNAIARIGWRKLQAGETVSPEELEANYIRRSDAEIFAKIQP